MKQIILRIGAKIIIGVFMTIVGGVLVGSILLKSLLFHPETLQPVEPDETSLIEK